MHEYEKVFKTRGGNYAKACDRWPTVRASEAAALVPDWYDGPVHRVCDVFAGTGVAAGPVERRLKPREIVAVEPTEMGKLLPKHYSWVSDTHELESCSADLTLCLAGTHHIQNKAPLFSELSRITSYGGHLAIADVEAATPPACFLRDVVGGHDNATFVLPNEFDRLMENFGFQPLASFHRPCTWFFESITPIEFLQTFFSLDAADEPHLVSKTRRIFGVDLRRDRYLPWSLRYTFGVRVPC